MSSRALRGGPARYANRTLSLPDLPQGARRSLRRHGGRHARAFSLDGGEERLSAYESSPGKLRRFCSVCGTHLLAERPIQPHVILRVATLDDDPGTRATMHIWTSHDAPWLADDDDVRRYLEWQPGR
jgi:hypothetical protein